MVEFLLPKQVVAGSNPVSRSATLVPILSRRNAIFRTGVQHSNRYCVSIRRNVAVKALAMIFWVSLVGSDPLVDPWETTFPRLDEIEVTTFYEPLESDAWRLDDNALLNPFVQE